MVTIINAFYVKYIFSHVLDFGNINKNVKILYIIITPILKMKKQQRALF
jgi:hypothetical protein